MATLTDSLLNGLKSLFSGLGAKTTDSNYAVPLVNKSTASPTGYMDMANLGQILGSWKYMDFLKSSNLPGGKFENMRTLNMNGLWGFSSTNLVPSDAPDGFQNGVIFHTNLYSDVSVQIVIERNLGMKTRFYWYGTWYAWK